VSVLCALGSALMYALASVLQQRSAAAQPADQALRLSLLARLLRTPLWLLGLACDVMGYVLQFIALGHGPIVVVQPLLVCGLLFALPLGAAWAGRKLRRLDWIAALLVCAGLAVFLLVASPQPGHDDVGPIVWVALLGGSAGVVLGLIASSRGRPAWQRAVLLSGAAGVIYGVTAALTKTSSHLLDGGIVALLGHWQPYALLIAGVAGMVIGQSAFQAGSLDASLPTMSVVDPIVSIVIGALAFGESIAAGPGELLLEVIALVGMSAGIVLLARSAAARSLHPSPSPPALA
jgi:drug/metabolite transporter (DMT)-like permease